MKGRTIPALFAGPYLGIRTNAKQVLVWKHGGERFGEKEDIKSLTRNLDYGLVFGASLEQKLCFGSIIFDIRYSLGFPNLWKEMDPTLSSVYPMEAKHKAFIIMVGLGF